MWKSGVSRRTQQFLLYRKKKKIAFQHMICDSFRFYWVFRGFYNQHGHKVYDVITYIHDVTTKFHCVTQIILYIWSCDQKISIPIREVNWENLNFLRTWPNRSFEGWSWFKFSNLGLAVGVSLENLEEYDKRAKI